MPQAVRSVLLGTLLAVLSAQPAFAALAWVQKTGSFTAGPQIAFCTAGSPITGGACDYYNPSSGGYTQGMTLNAADFPNTTVWNFEDELPQGYGFTVADAVTLNWLVIGCWAVVFGVRLIGRSAKP
jgi:hypothetical protein